MGMFYSIRNFFRGPGAPSRDAGLQSGQPGGYATGPASVVNTDTAMQISAVWAAVRLIAETIGSLPFDIVDKDTRLPADDDRLGLRNVLKNKPNQYQTPVEFWESMALNLALSGNAYAIIQRSGNRIVGLLPVSSSQVQTTLLPDGTITHEYTQGNHVGVYTSRTMWHIKLFGNGIVGMSPLSYARNSVGIAQAADNRVSAIYSNGAKPSGILTIDKTLTEDQRKQVRESFNGMSEGNQDRLFVLEAGMKYSQVSMTPNDIQLLDSRRFQIEDIGRFFGVPSILLNQTFGQSSLGSNVYEIVSGFYKLNLRPYLEKIEASILRWLIEPEDWGKFEARFEFDALLRADTKTRMDANRVAIYSGQMTPNEARASEGRAALDGGDELMIQGATVPIEQAGMEQSRNAPAAGENDDSTA